MTKGITFSFCEAERSTVISDLKNSEDGLFCWVSELAVWGLKTDQIIMETGSVYILRQHCLGIKNR
jgi:hypothetical protein